MSNKNHKLKEKLNQELNALSQLEEAQNNACIKEIKALPEFTQLLELSQCTESWEMTIPLKIKCDFVWEVNNDYLASGNVVVVPKIPNKYYLVSNFLGEDNIGNMGLGRDMHNISPVVKKQLFQLKTVHKKFLEKSKKIAIKHDVEFSNILESISWDLV